jgi:hypothetical protein
VERCLEVGADMKLGGGVAGEAGGDISGIGMMKSGRKGVDGGERSRNGLFVQDKFLSLRKAALGPADSCHSVVTERQQGIRYLSQAGCV